MARSDQPSYNSTKTWNFKDILLTNLSVIFKNFENSHTLFFNARYLYYIKEKLYSFIRRYDNRCKFNSRCYNIILKGKPFTIIPLNFHAVSSLMLR